MQNTITIPIDINSLIGYETFLKCKQLPRYEVKGNTIETDEESYRLLFGGDVGQRLSTKNKMLFDYQGHIVNIALEKKRYAAFLDCGLGKTAIQLEWCKQVAQTGKVLLLCPLAVMDEFYKDIQKFNMGIELVNLRKGEKWTDGIGILNFESLKDLNMKGVQGICLDESSILKNGEGTTRNWIVGVSRNVPYRLACSATPAPNEQSEYASHAVFLGINSTSKEFYSRFFRKQGNDWLLKPHAVKPFYQNMQKWACYIQDPEQLGFERGGHLADEPEYIELPCSGGEEFINGVLINNEISFSDANRVYAYRAKKDTDRFGQCVENATSCKSIVWCKRDAEEKAFMEEIPGSKLITGKTPVELRVELINAFRDGELNCLISKPEILGWGVNLQQAEAHIFSGYDFSFEKFYQAVRRSHRFPREGRLKVFLPYIPAELPLLEALNKKIKSFKQDVSELQKLFWETI